MSTNKASCRNTTSPLWHLELLSDQVFSHTFRPWEFAFSPSRHWGRETERLKERTRQRTRQLRESEIWAGAPATRRLHCKDGPHGPAIFIWAQSGHTQPCDPALQTSVRAHLRHLPYIPSASRFGFTPLILSEKAGEEVAEGNSWEVDGVGKWVRGLRPKRRQLPPSAPRSSSRILGVALAASLRCGGDSWWGTFESSAILALTLLYQPGPEICRNLRIGELVWRVFDQATSTFELEMVSDMDCYSERCHVCWLTHSGLSIPTGCDWPTTAFSLCCGPSDIWLNPLHMVWIYQGSRGNTI